MANLIEQVEPFYLTFSRAFFIPEDEANGSPAMVAVVPMNTDGFLRELSGLVIMNGVERVGICDCVVKSWCPDPSNPESMVDSLIVLLDKVTWSEDPLHAAYIENGKRFSEFPGVVYPIEEGTTTRRIRAEYDIADEV